VLIAGALASGSAAAVLVTLVTVGPGSGTIVFGAVVAVQEIEGHVVQPLVMGHMLRLHRMAILLTVSVGTLLGGVYGALVAVPAWP
jgi:putative heme transporter